MQCELCGNRKAGFKISVEGSELLVCSNCKTDEAVEIEAKKEAPEVKIAVSEEVLDLYPDYGNRIKTGRKDRGIGRGDLSAKLGIKESFLQKIESQDMEPDDSLIIRIEKTLGVRLRGKIEYKLQGHVEKKATTLGDIVELK